MKLNSSTTAHLLPSSLSKRQYDVSGSTFYKQFKIKYMITYVLTISQKFPKTHIRSGGETNFYPLILRGKKKHTIRGNYELWAKRFEKIKAGKAILSIRIWEGKPYNSKQIELLTFDNTKGIGIEKILFDDYLYSCLINNKRFSVGSEMIAENDGLTPNDFENWFRGYDFSKPMAIIHFTDFRYCH